MRSSAQHVSKKRRQHSQRRAEYVPRGQRRVTTLLARKRLVSDRIESTNSVAASGRCSFFSSVEAAVSAAVLVFCSASRVGCGINKSRAARPPLQRKSRELGLSSGKIDNMA